jgi:hypothetical protein
VNDELGGTDISRHLRGGTEENNERPSESRQRIKPVVSLLRVINVTAAANLLGSHDFIFLFSPFSSVLLSIFVCIPRVFPFASFYFCLLCFFLLFSTPVRYLMYCLPLFSFLLIHYVSLPWPCIIFASFPSIVPYYGNDGRTAHLEEASEMFLRNSATTSP